MSGVKKFAAASLAMMLLGAAAGALWARIAEPSQWHVSGGQLMMGESDAAGQFSVIVMFVIIGAVASLLWGFTVGLRLRDLGWIAVPVVVVVCLLASAVAWRVGIWLGPPDPRNLSDLSNGSVVSERLAIDTLAAFFAWPIAGLAGFLLAALLEREDPSLTDDARHGPAAASGFADTIDQ